MSDISHLTNLRDRIAEKFDLSEIKELCFEMGVSYDDLTGETKTVKIQSLLEYSERRGKKKFLLERLHQHRPTIDWNAIEGINVNDDTDESPYRGLEYFDVADAENFFGRDNFVADIIDKLHKKNLLFLVGASGCGKSSIARAGVIATLQQRKPLAQGHLLQNSKDWRYVIMTPDRPLHNLAATLTSDAESVRAAITLMNDMRTDAHSLDLYCTRISNKNKKVFILVDQFEELFTSHIDTSERKAFIDNLITATYNKESSPVTVLVTLRADFYNHCLAYDNLRAVLTENQILVGEMNKEELRLIIETPAQNAGFILEKRLVTELLDETDDAGKLPLLSLAMQEIWKRRDVTNHLLTYGSYETIGKLKGAINHTADLVFNDLTPIQKQIARKIFLRLTALGEGTEDSRRRAPLSELIPLKSEKEGLISETQLVLKKLADARLVITDQDSAEIIHEALIREWQRLRLWLNENREGLHIHHELVEDVKEWNDLDRSKDVLYRGTKLAKTLEWQSKFPDELNENENLFLKTSVEVEQESRAQENAQRERELRQTKKLLEEQKSRVRLGRIFIGALSAMLIITTLIAVQAYLARQDAVLQKNRAESQSLLAKSRELIARSITESDKNPILGLLLSIQSYAITQTAQTRVAPLIALQANPRLIGSLNGHKNFVSRLSFSPDGTMLASGSWDSKVIVWDTRDLSHIHKIGAPLVGHADSISAIAFASNNKILITGSQDKSIIIWDIKDANGEIETIATLKSHQNAITGLAFSPDGDMFASADSGGVVNLWSIDKQKQIQLKDSKSIGKINAVNNLSFSPDGRLLAFFGADNNIHLWSVHDLSNDTNNAIITLVGHSGAIGALSFSHDSKVLAVGSEDSSIVLWDVRDAQNPQKIGYPLKGHNFLVIDATFSPDNKTLMSSGGDKAIILWDLKNRDDVKQSNMSLNGYKFSTNTIAFSPDSRILASGERDNSVDLWNLNDLDYSSHVGTILDKSANPIKSLAISPNGKFMALGYQNSLINLFDISNLPSITKIQTFSQHTNEVSGLSFSPDGNFLASSSWDNTIILWNLKDLDHIKENSQVLTGHASRILSICFSPGGNILASGGEDGTIILWDMRNLRQPGNTLLKAHDGAASALAFSADSKTLVSGGDDRNIVFWNVNNDATSVIRRNVISNAHLGRVSSLAFSPNGKTFASASWDKSIIFWDYRDSLGVKPLTLPLLGHQEGISRISFSSDGKTLATGSSDKNVVLWDIQDIYENTDQQGISLVLHKDNVTDLSFLPNKKSLLSVGKDGAMILWDVDDVSWRKKACSIANRNLTTEEWQRFIPDSSYLKTCPDLMENDQ